MGSDLTTLWHLCAFTNGRNAKPGAAMMATGAQSRAISPALKLVSAQGTTLDSGLAAANVGHACSDPVSTPVGSRPVTTKTEIARRTSDDRVAARNGRWAALAPRSKAYCRWSWR